MLSSLRFKTPTDFAQWNVTMTQQTQKITTKNILAEIFQGQKLYIRDSGITFYWLHITNRRVGGDFRSHDAYR